MRPNYLTFCFALALVGSASHQSTGSELEAEVAPTVGGQWRDVVAVTEATSSVDGAGSQDCPSDDFGKFFRAFLDSASVQRQFTRLPIEHGQLDAAAIGTAHEYTLKRINTFENIPSFDSRNGGVILPNARSRTKGRYRLAIEPEKTPEDPEYPTERKARDDRIARLFIDDTGFHIYYRFQRLDGCWFLRAIHDKST